MNNVKAIEAYQAIEDATLIYSVTIDKNGKELDSEPILDGMNAIYNCTGKLVDRKFTIDASLISMEDLIDIEGYSKLNFDDKPQYGDLGVYVNKEDGKILHYELFLDDTGKVDAKGGFENYVERPNGGTDRNWGDTYYVRLRLNNQKQDSDGK